MSSKTTTNSEAPRQAWWRTLNSMCGAMLLIAIALLSIAVVPATAQAQQQRPNILFIMGDDVGWFNIGAYHQGIMSGQTPNLDRLASEGMRFTDYYAEASCTAGRANFITGELPIRTGMTTVGQAGADVGLPAQAPTIATALKSMGYTTGQFGKNHLGDLNKYLPCVHGFDEFFGYLYHLDAMSDPYWYSYPTDPAVRNAVGPRNLVHCWASDTDDSDGRAALGRRRQAEDRGRRPARAGTEHRTHALWRRRRRCRRRQIRHDHLRRGPGQGLDRLHEEGQGRAASRSSSGTTPRACTSGRSCPRNTRR